MFSFFARPSDLALFLPFIAEPSIALKYNMAHVALLYDFIGEISAV